MKLGAAPLLTKDARPVIRSSSIRSTVEEHSCALSGQRERIRLFSIRSAVAARFPARSIFSRKTEQSPEVSAASRPAPMPSLRSA